MARSKSGGSRAFLRGRIASDVYSVGKDSRGNRQQIVRSRPESVVNPMTLPQQVVRMCMKTSALALKELSVIVNHSWEGVPYGQMSVSEFNRINFAALKSQYETEPDVVGKFSYATPSTRGMQLGPYQVSKGSLVVPSSLTYPMTEGMQGVAILTTSVEYSAQPKVSDIKAALGVSEGDYITILGFVASADGLSVSPRFQRFYFEPSIPADTVVTNANIAQVFRTEGNNAPYLTIMPGSSDKHEVWFGNADVFGNSVDGRYSGTIILSRKFADAWLRSSSFIQIYADEWDGFTADQAIEEWPIGEVRFLNGGDLT